MRGGTATLSARVVVYSTASATTRLGSVPRRNNLGSCAEAKPKSAIIFAGFDLPTTKQTTQATAWWAG